MQVAVIVMKTLLEVKVPVVVGVLFAFLAVMVIGTPSILVGWIDSLVTFLNPDDGVVKGWYDWVSSRQ